MKNKEIDVTKCQCFENDKCLWQKRYYETSFCPNCKDVKNCYFKQLQKLKEKLKPFQDDYFKGLSTQDIAGLAKKSIRLAKNNCDLMNRNFKYYVMGKLFPEGEMDRPTGFIRYFETKQEAEKFIKDEKERGDIIEISDIQTTN